MSGISNYGLKQLAAPTAEPIDVPTLVQHSRIFAWDADNAIVSACISAARDLFETMTNRQVMQAQYLMTLNAFPGRYPDEFRPIGWRFGTIRLPKPPLVSVDQIQYIDAGTALLTTLDPALYQITTKFEPGRIAPARLQVWPIADPYSLDAVQVTFTCGWGTTPNDTKIPARVLQAIKGLAAHLYEHREATEEATINEIPWGLKEFIKSCGYGEYA